MARIRFARTVVQTSCTNKQGMVQLKTDVDYALQKEIINTGKDILARAFSASIQSWVRHPKPRARPRAGSYM